MNMLLLSTSILIFSSQAYHKPSGTTTKPPTTKAPTTKAPTMKDTCPICVHNGFQCSHKMDGSCLPYSPYGPCPSGSKDCIGQDPCERCLEVFPDGACRHNNDNTCYPFPVEYGSCYAHTTPCLPEEEPCPNAYNLMFIIDESGSIGSLNYGPAIDVVIDLILDAVNSNAKLAAFAFGKGVDPIYSFADDQNDRNGILTALNAEKGDYEDGSATNLEAALTAAILDFDNADPSIPNVIVILTDGQPTDNPCTPAIDTALTDIRVIIAGIGTNFDSQDVMCLVGDDSDIFTIGGFGPEELDALEDSITEMLCPDDGLPEGCDNCINAGKQCIHDDNGSCDYFQDYGLCAPGSTDCTNTPPCKRCRDIYKPCLHAMDKRSCYRPEGGWYGLCPQGYIDCRSW